MAFSIKFGTGVSPFSSPELDVLGDNPPGSPFAPLYDEIILVERIYGETYLLEYAEASPAMVELLCSFRLLREASTTHVLEQATGTPTLSERIVGVPTIFEH